MDLPDIDKISPQELTDIMSDYVKSDVPHSCLWQPELCPGCNPHVHAICPELRNTMVFENILEVVGNTPIVKLNRIPQSLGLRCDVYVKCEFFNPGASIKDRIALRMIQDAESQGLVNDQTTFIEPSSGNTGIGLALAATVKGYRCIIIVPEQTSKEKLDILHVLGAEVVKVPTGVHYNAPNGLMGMAHVINKMIPNSIVFNQFRSPSNPMAHYDCTAEEILETLGVVHLFACSGGTGGTLTGVARKLKQKCPACVIVGADPEGSKMAEPECLNEFDLPFTEVEGLNYSFVPSGLDQNSVDYWMKVKDVDAYAMTRRLIREEGIMCGASGGLNVYATCMAAKNLSEGKKCIVIIPDDLRNYISTVASDQWLEAKNLRPSLNVHNFSWWDSTVRDLDLQDPVTIKFCISCKGALKKMTEKNADQMGVLTADGFFIGTITSQILTAKLMSGSIVEDDPVQKAVSTIFLKVNEDTSLGLVSRILEVEHYTVVVEECRLKQKLVAFITNMDFLRHIHGNKKARCASSCS